MAGGPCGVVARRPDPFGVTSRVVSDPVHDTVDLAEELGDIDAVLASGSVDLATREQRVGSVEGVLVTVANGIWAVVGLVLWLPQVVRAVLGAALRTVHAALTNQSSDRAIAGIRRVSRSYVERFLRRTGEPSHVARRHELRPVHLLLETGWLAAFYLLLIRWLAPGRFAAIWGWLEGLWGAAWNRTLGLGAAALGILRPDLANLDVSRLQAAAVLFVAALVGVVLGVWLGRRGR
jgi:hypothetical protein